jgi:putative hydrolase of the HAD superfamily
MHALLFDFGGTLDCPRHWLDRFVGHYRAAGLRVTRDQLEPAFNAATLFGYRAGSSIWNYGLSELIRFQVAKQLEWLIEQSPVPAGLSTGGSLAATELRERISQSFTAESTVGLRRSRDIVSSFADKFAIGIASNFYGNLDRILEDAGFNGVLSAVADSGRLGIYKPNSGIFETVLATLQADAGSTVMIGDSLGKDCAPARRLGMRTIWLRHQEASAEKPAAADFTIDSLDELEEVLWRMA